jgi:hypothetical protein
MVGKEMILTDQINRNYGRLRGWLLARMFNGIMVYSDWSPR